MEPWAANLMYILYDLGPASLKAGAGAQLFLLCFLGLASQGQWVSKIGFLGFLGL